MNSVLPAKYQVCTTYTLKVIALISMFVDHFAILIIYNNILLPNAPIQTGTPLYILYLVYRGMRMFGRMAFPLFAFVLVEGFRHTSNRRNYAIRLAAFALLAEIPRDYIMKGSFFDWNSCNVFFTLLIGFLMMWILDLLKDHFWAQIPVMAAACALAWFINSDYDYLGIILILALYLFQYYRGLQIVAGCVSLLWSWPSMFAFIPIAMYNQKRGPSMKYFFYFFYPAHLILLYFLSIILF